MWALKDCVEDPLWETESFSRGGGGGCNLYIPVHAEVCNNPSVSNGACAVHVDLSEGV